MEAILSCPVCSSPLWRDGSRYLCEKGHSFDIARQGYVNLLCGKRPTTHGDNAEMIAARGRFLSAGYYLPLIEGLQDVLRRYVKRDTRLLDIGCGEGYYTEGAARILSHMASEIFAFDISKDALKAAAKRHCASLFVASAYKIPVLDACMDYAMLFFSPFCPSEILRVLKKDGIFLMAFPGERHLWGLKRAVYDTPYLNSPESTAIEGMALLEKKDISEEIHLPDNRTITDLFAMTPYYYKTAEQDKAKLGALTSLTTEISFHLCVYQKL